MLQSPDSSLKTLTQLGDTAVTGPMASICPPLFICSKHESKPANTRKYLHLDVPYNNKHRDIRDNNSQEAPDLLKSSWNLRKDRFYVYVQWY